MPYPIEIIATKEEIYKHAEKAMQPLNQVQNEFRFEFPGEAYRKMPYSFVQQHYYSTDIFAWLANYRSKAGGYRPFIILIIDGTLEGETKGNLFGNRSPEEGFAVFTINNFGQFVNDITRFCRYYLVRYSLSFFAPDILSHQSNGCMFDNKNRKSDILFSLNTGNICDDCMQKINPRLNEDIRLAITSLLQIVSNQHPYAIIMKGGGVKGLAFAGALQELEKHFSFNCFAGTSAGAIAAILLGAGYKPTELLIKMREKNFSDFMDVGLLQCIGNFIKGRYLFDGKSVEDWIEGLIQEKYTQQMGAVEMQHLQTRAIVYASRVTDGTITFDSKGDRRNARACYAARCSMSIPYFFAPAREDGIKVYDGGWGNNFPLTQFVENNRQIPFIGLYLKSRNKKRGLTISQLADIAIDQDERTVVDNNRDKIVVINTLPIKTTDFKLSNDKKEFLILAGRVGALQYLRDYRQDINIDMAELTNMETKLEKMRAMF